MSLFKKLFGDGNKKRKKSNHPDLKSLLDSPDINNSIIELDNFICQLGPDDTLDALTLPQKNFHYNQNLEREVNNGGFNQFFFNSSGDFAHETVISLQAIGANKTAAILQKAIDQFPNAIIPQDRDERQSILDEIEDIANEVWNDLDERFYLYEDNLNILNIEYVRKNQDSF